MKISTFLLILSSIGSSFALGACGNSSVRNPANQAAATVSNTSVLSIKKLENGSLLLNLSDACESLSNIIMPEATDLVIGIGDSSSHFVSYKPTCTTQSDGKCGCTCPAGSNPMTMRAENPKVANTSIGYADVVFCAPISK